MFTDRVTLGAGTVWVQAEDLRRRSQSCSRMRSQQVHATHNPSLEPQRRGGGVGGGGGGGVAVVGRALSVYVSVSLRVTGSSDV